MNLLRYILAGGTVLGILVLLHEWGHFVAAKLCGVRVDVFSIGFGPRLWGVKRGDTDYRVSALPLGGYVRMAGDNPVEERTGAPYEFLSRPRWQRFLIAIAGPTANILFTFVLFWGLFAFTSEPFLPPVIVDVVAGSPAQSAGLTPGDFILSMNGKTIQTSSESVDLIRKSNGLPIEFVVRREGTEVPLTITPMSSQNPKGQAVWMIGAAIDQQGRAREGFFLAGRDAALSTAIGSQKILSVLAGLVTGHVSVRELAGPVSIMRLSGQAAKTGPMRFFELLAVISLNLGLLNLMPIPILDGGHVLMLAIEGTMRRDLSIRFKERFVQVGLVFLLGLFAFVMYNDILRIIKVH